MARPKGISFAWQTKVARWMGKYRMVYAFVICSSVVALWIWAAFFVS